MKLINGKTVMTVVSQGDNAQIEANMNKVFSLLQEDIIFELAA